MPSGPIEITGLSTGPVKHSTRPTITLAVSNLTGVTQVVRLSWYLAAAHDVTPWADAQVGSVPTQVTLGPWATSSIGIRGYRLAPIGQWELSAWSHYQQKPGVFTQADVLWLTQAVSVT